MGPRAAPGPGGTLLAVLAVALLLPVVALASRPEGGAGGAPPSPDPARLVLDVVAYLLVVLCGISLVVIVWALWPRPDEELPALPPRRRWVLGTVLTTVVFVGVAVWLRSQGRIGTPPNLAAGGAAALPAALLPPEHGAAPSGFDWLAAGIVAGALLTAAALGWWFLRPRRRAAGARLARLRSVLDDAVEDVLGEADPRRTVIATWARLERVLARHGLPRRESEAPFEYAARAGAKLGVEGGWLERLAGLFEWARFSTHDVTPAMREEALGGLVAVRDGLRAAS